jgi:hypothetical protein
MTTISRLTLIKKIIIGYCENHTKPINTLYGQNAELLNVKAGGTYGYHWALTGYGRRMKWKHDHEEG